MSFPLTSRDHRKADITKLQVDAIVNAAKSDLKGQQVLDPEEKVAL